MVNVDFNNFAYALDSSNELVSVDMSEDVVSFALFMHLRHPNFFSGNSKANGRFVIWLLYASTIILLQLMSVFMVIEQS